MTPQQWAKCVLVLRSAYGASFKLDEEGVVVWFEMLRDLDGARVLAAVERMVKSQKAFPSIADIRALAEPEKNPGEVWAEVLRVVLETGPYGKYIAPPDALLRGENGRIIGRTAEGHVEHGAIPPAAAKALESIGGRAAILEAESQTALRILRTQFVAALEQFQAAASVPEPAIAAPKAGPIQLADATQAIGRRMPGGAA